jgi:hypothetical protein
MIGYYTIMALRVTMGMKIKVGCAVKRSRFGAAFGCKPPRLIEEETFMFHSVRTFEPSYETTPK